MREVKHLEYISGMRNKKIKSGDLLNVYSKEKKASGKPRRNYSTIRTPSLE